MKSGWDLKGRDFEYDGPHDEYGGRATVLDVRVDTAGQPLTVLVRHANGIVEWMQYTMFNTMYAQIVPEAPAKRGRRTTQAPVGDELDDLWGQVMKDAA